MALRAYKCSKCGGSEFLLQKTGRQRERVRRCKPCRTAYISARLKTPEFRRRLRENNDKWWSNPASTIRRRYYSKKSNDRRRAEMIRAYGGKCECCSESRPQFLSIDHIGKNGNAHRREDAQAGNISTWLKRRSWPQDNFRLLCFNCNLAKGLHGFCHPEIQ